MQQTDSFSLSSSAVKNRTILRNVYLWMTAGLALTGVVALFVSTNRSFVRALATNPLLFWGLIIGEVALVFYLSARITKMSPTAATGAFAVYAALNGVTLSLIFIAYTGVTLATAFFVTAGTFAGMSLYAVTTKTDLSGFGNYLMMALIGIIIASVVNFFLQSTLMYWIISYAGVGIFMGLTAYDTQIIKRWSEQLDNSVDESMFIKISILGALKLYLDFINLFLFFLRIFGGSRN